MDKDLKFYLLSLGFAEEDVLNMINTTPSLKIATYEQALDNVMEIVAKGFPIEDIDSLIFANPKILCTPTPLLKESLDQIVGNIEESLKNDPFII